jgi:hypothetical protein
MDELDSKRERQRRIEMEKEKIICTVVHEEYWITEEERQIILEYRSADKNIKDAVDKILDVVD